MAAGNVAACEENKVVTSCRGLLRLASNVQVKGVIAPREMILTLSNTIERRDHLHKWFGEQSLGPEGEEANIRHKVFNSTLVSIYNSLKITKTTHTFAIRPKQLKPASSESDLSLPELYNRFAYLDHDSDSESNESPERLPSPLTMTSS